MDVEGVKVVMGKVCNNERGAAFCLILDTFWKVRICRL